MASVCSSASSVSSSVDTVEVHNSACHIPLLPASPWSRLLEPPSSPCSSYCSSSSKSIVTALLSEQAKLRQRVPPFVLKRGTSRCGGQHRGKQKLRFFAPSPSLLPNRPTSSEQARLLAAKAEATECAVDSPPEVDEPVTFVVRRNRYNAHRRLHHYDASTRSRSSDNASSDAYLTDTTNEESKQHRYKKIVYDVQTGQHNVLEREPDASAKLSSRASRKPSILVRSSSSSSLASFLSNSSNRSCRMSSSRSVGEETKSPVRRGGKKPLLAESKNSKSRASKCLLDDQSVTTFTTCTETTQTNSSFHSHSKSFMSSAFSTPATPAKPSLGTLLGMLGNASPYCHARQQPSISSSGSSATSFFNDADDEMTNQTSTNDSSTWSLNSSNLFSTRKHCVSALHVTGSNNTPQPYRRVSCIQEGKVEDLEESDTDDSKLFMKQEGIKTNNNPDTNNSHVALNSNTKFRNATRRNSSSKQTMGSLSTTLQMLSNLASTHHSNTPKQHTDCDSEDDSIQSLIFVQQTTKSRRPVKSSLTLPMSNNNAFTNEHSRQNRPGDTKNKQQVLLPTKMPVKNAPIYTQPPRQYSEIAPGDHSNLRQLLTPASNGLNAFEKEKTISKMKKQVVNQSESRPILPQRNIQEEKNRLDTVHSLTCCDLDGSRQPPKIPQRQLRKHPTVGQSESNLTRSATKRSVSDSALVRIATVSTSPSFPQRPCKSFIRNRTEVFSIAGYPSSPIPVTKVPRRSTMNPCKQNNPLELQKDSVVCNIDVANTTESGHCPFLPILPNKKNNVSCGLDDNITSRSMPRSLCLLPPLATKSKSTDKSVFQSMNIPLAVHVQTSSSPHQPVQPQFNISPICARNIQRISSLRRLGAATAIEQLEL